MVKAGAVALRGLPPPMVPAGALPITNGAAPEVRLPGTSGGQEQTLGPGDSSRSDVTSQAHCQPEMHTTTHKHACLRIPQKGSPQALAG